MSRTPNVIEIDATVLDSTSLLVPRDITNSEVVNVPTGTDFSELDAYEFANASVRASYSAKVVNDADEVVDAQVCVTTSDDEAFQSYDTDGTASVATGSPPDNVELQHGTLTAASLNVDLTAATTPTTGTVTVVFNSRLYGSA